MPKAQVKQIKPGSQVFRHLQIEKKMIDEDARTVALAFSSEEPYERYWGIEVLDHSNKSIRLARLKNGGPLLMDHDSRDHVGVIESVEIGADRVGRAVVRFGRSQRAEEIFTDVKDGIRNHVSVGYMIHKALLEETGDDGDTYRVSDWEPFEVSMVSVPADATVGVGRSHEQHDDGDPIEFIEPETKSENKKIETRRVEMPEEKKNKPDQPTVDHLKVERQRTADLIALGKQYERFGGNEMAASFITEDKSVDALRAALLEKAASQPTQSAEIGMNKDETRKFSIVRALRAMANPGDRKLAEDAAFERECSEAVGQKMGRAAQGFFLPQEVMQRDLTVGIAADGGNLVSTDLLSGSFIDLLRNAMVLSDLGAQFLPGLVGDVAIPRQSGGATSYWVAEGGAPTESQQAFDQVPLTPKTVGAFTDISRKLLLQSSIGIEQFVQGDLAKILGLAIQQAAISGTGAGNQPTGILNTTAIGDVAGGVNGAAPNFGNIIELETDVSVADADVGTLGYLTNALMRGKLKQTFVDAGSNAERIWAQGDTPLNGYRSAVTNAVPSNLVKGTSSDCSAIVFGNFADLLIGMWGALDLTVDPYALSTSGAVRIVALQDVDVAVRHAESFSAMQDARNI